MRFLRRTFILILLLFVSSISYAQESARFDSAKEFPNLFLPKNYRNQPSDVIPREVVSASRVLLENALKSIFERLSVPIVPEGENEVSVISYYPYLYERLSKIDPDVKIYPSGGVVRSALGYIYHQIFMSPGQDTQSVLTAIAKGKEPIAGFDIRGVGSDFDLLVISKNFSQIERAMLQVTNSAEAHYGMRDSKDPAKRTFFTIGDVKEYASQTDRSTKQGGSWIDFLSFDPKTGKFVEPENAPGIVEALLLGHNRYFPPQRDQHPENAKKQTIRGVRPLLELPFLTYDAESQAILRGELESLKAELKGSAQVDRKVVDQFEKIVRNARFSGAHNRLYRAQVNSLDALIFDVFSLISQKLGHVAVPEFVDHFPLEARDESKTELRGVRPETLLPRDRFISEYTNKGVIYHGTPEFFKALAIMRGGLFISRQGQGNAGYGRGAYSSKDRSVAQGYAGQNGIVLELAITQDPHLNILVWNERTQKDLVIQDLIRKYEGKLDPIFEDLARNHGIDIIINGHVLIQNTAALDLSLSLGVILKSLWHRVNNPTLNIMERVSAYFEFEKYRKYALNLGIDVTDTINKQELVAGLKEALSNNDSGIRTRAVWALVEIGFDKDDPEITSQLTRLLCDDSLNARTAAEKVFREKKLVPDSEVFIGILRNREASGTNKYFAISYLGTWKVKSALVDIKPYLSCNDSNLRSVAAWAVGEIGVSDPEITSQLTRLLCDDSLNARTTAEKVFREKRLVPDSNTFLEILRDEKSTWTQQYFAISYLGTWKVKSALVDIKPYLSCNDSNLRSVAAWAVGEIGVSDPEITTRLNQLLSDGDYNVRTSAEKALQKQKASLAKALEQVNEAMAVQVADQILNKYPQKQGAIPTAELGTYFRAQLSQEARRVIDTEKLSERLLREMSEPKTLWDKSTLLCIVKECMREARRVAEK